MFLFESWHVDAKVAIKLQNTCFEAFIGFEGFKQNTKFLEFVKTSYVNSVFRFDVINLHLGLEDIYFLLGLPVDGRPLVGDDFLADQLCQTLLGRDDPNRDPKKAVLTNKWLMDEFQHVPENIGVNDLAIIPYVRAYILFIIGTLLFPESEKATVPILYLDFLRVVTPEALNGFAWGAAVLAKPHSWLSGDLINSKGAVWILELFFLERIVRVRRDLLVNMQDVPAQFPSFKGWGSLLRRPSSNAHYRVPWAQTFSNIQVEDVRWRPYDRFGMASQRIFYSRTILFNFETILYHRPDLVPQQLGIQNLDGSQLTEPIRLKPKSKRGHTNRRLMHHYSRYIQEWDEQRYNTCIKDTSEVFVLPDLPHQHVVPPQEEPHGDSPMQSHEEVHRNSPVLPQDQLGEDSLGAALHGNSSPQFPEDPQVPEIEATEDEDFRKGIGGAGVETVIACGAGVDDGTTSHFMDHGDSRSPPRASPSHHLPEDYQELNKKMRSAYSEHYFIDLLEKPVDANMERNLRRSTRNRGPPRAYTPSEIRARKPWRKRGG
ncbi:hypothetical protein LguiA_032287 [Lonicera macranthoides]